MPPEAPPPPESSVSPEALLMWSEPFRVRAYEVGGGGVASPLAMLDYFQEAAGEHANALGGEFFDIGEAGGAWVMQRLSAQFDRLPGPREALTVETWAGQRDGLRIHRHFLARGADGTPLARAASAWFVVDIARRRPVRLPAAVAALELPDRPPALMLGPAPAGVSGEPEAALSFRVRQADVDRNGHANNARFAEWALEAVDRPLADLRALDLAFKSEALGGETVESVASPAELSPEASGGQAFAHAILRASDRRSLATARTLWR